MKSNDTIGGIIKVGAIFGILTAIIFSCLCLNEYKESKHRLNYLVKMPVETKIVPPRNINTNIYDYPSYSYTHNALFLWRNHYAP